MSRLANDVALERPLDERKAAMVGGFVSGALTGLAADLAAGGLTFGAGLLAGGVAGALGGAGIARGFNLARGKTESIVRWSDEFMRALVPGAVLRYLAVAHYGRGRGAWSAGETPSFWREAVAAAVDRHGDLGRVFALRRSDDCNTKAIARMLGPILAAMASDTLKTLYPDSPVPPLPGAQGSADNATAG